MFCFRLEIILELLEISLREKSKMNQLTLTKRKIISINLSPMLGEDNIKLRISLELDLAQVKTLFVIIH